MSEKTPHRQGRRTETQLVMQVGMEELLGLAARPLRSVTLPRRDSFISSFIHEDYPGVSTEMKVKHTMILLRLCPTFLTPNGVVEEGKALLTSTTARDSPYGSALTCSFLCRVRILSCLLAGLLWPASHQATGAKSRNG